MKNKSFISLAILVIFIGIVGFFAYKSAETEKFGGLTSNTIAMTATTSSEHGWLGTSYTDPAILGSSTATGMTDPISKTITVGDDADKFCMNIYWKASTTDAVLQAKYYASQDGTYFYPIDTNNAEATSTDQYNISTTTVDVFPSDGTTDLRLKHICPYQFRNLNTRYIKIEFVRATDLSGGLLYAEGWWKTN